MKYAIAITLVIILIEGIHIYLLLKNKLKKEIILSVILVTIALIYCYNEIFFWKLPGPSEFITKATDPISKLVFGKDID